MTASHLLVVINGVSWSVLVLDQEVWYVVIGEEGDGDRGVALAVRKRRFPNLLERFAAKITN